MKNQTYDYIILFSIFIFSFLLSGRIDFTNPGYNRMDFHYYIQMAESSPGISKEIPHFFAYRIFPPWLVGLIPGSTEFGFSLLNFFSLIILVYVFYKLMLEINLQKYFALFATFLFVFNRYFFQLQAWNYFQLTDIISNTIIFYSVILVRRNKIIKAALLLLLGVLSKETTLVVIPILLVNIFQKNISLKEKLILSQSIFPALALFILLRIFIPTLGEENLLYQTAEESWKYLSINVWIKTWIIPFIPFSFIPIIFYKEFISFCKRNIDLTILFFFVGFTTMLGFDYERLAAPSSPLIFGFVGFIIEKTIQQKQFNTKDIVLIILLTIVASLYHLWGIIRLPNATYSLAISLATLTFVTIIFIRIKLKSNSSSESFS